MSADAVDTYYREIAVGPWSSPTDPGHRVGAALRRLAIEAMAGAPDDEALDALATRLEAIVGAPASTASRYRPEDRLAPDGTGRIRPNRNGTHPSAGTRNAIAPPIVLARFDDPERGPVATGDVVYDIRFEGMPGYVQGGFLAAGFDLMVAQGIVLTGTGGVTGTLTIRYRTPTPLHRALRYEAWCDRTEGRKSFGAGRLVAVDDGTVFAEAEGVFVTPRVMPQ